MKKPKNFLEKYELIVLGLILVYSFILRVLFLDNSSMWIDETISSVAAKGILEHGYPLLESGAVYARAEIFHYLMSFFILVFGGDFGARFVSVIFGVLTVYLGYVFGKKFIGNTFGGLGLSFIMAVSSISILYSKQARFYQMFQFFYFLTFYLFYKIVILKEDILGKKYFDYFLIVLSLLLTIHLQILGFALIPLLGLVYLIHNYSDLKKDMKKFVAILIFLLGVSAYLVNRMVESFSGATDFFRFYSGFFSGYWVLILFGLVGLVYGLFVNFKFHSSFSLLGIGPMFGLFFIEVFATRYAYFIFFVLFFYVIYLLDKIHFNYIVLFVMILFFSATIFSFTGLRHNERFDVTAPYADFKNAYLNLPEGIVVSTWTPASVWYGNGSDYWVYYSVSGRSNETWTRFNDIERFSGAEIIYSLDDVPSDDFVFVLDDQARRKIRPSLLEGILDLCELSYSYFNIDVFVCNSS